MKSLKLENIKVFWGVALAGNLLALCLFFVLGALTPGRLHIEMSNSNSNSNSNIDLGMVSVDSGDGKGFVHAGTVSLMTDGKKHVYEVDAGNALSKMIRFIPSMNQGESRINKLAYESFFYSRVVRCDELQSIHSLEVITTSQDECAFRSTGDKPSVDFAVFKRKNYSQLQLKWGAVVEGLTYALLTFSLIYLAFRTSGPQADATNKWFTSKLCIRLYLILLFGFASFVYLNLNVSSIGMWKSYVHGQSDDGVLLGSPRAIRSDEWFVQTPFHASQVANNFIENNPSLGADNIALTAAVPVRGLYGYAQPRFWGFYALGFEKGLAWLSAFRIFGLIFTCFVLLSIVTKGDFWVSVTGALWILLSPFTQWWFGTNLPDMIIGFSGGIASLYLLLRTKSMHKAAIAGLVFLISSTTFITALYPAFQIPLFHLALFVMVGLIARDNLIDAYQSAWKYKSACLVIVIGAIFLFLLIWYKQAIIPIELVLNSVYPGKRLSLGGDLALAKEFSGYFSPYLRVDRYPAALGNISEAGNFMLFFPLAWVVMLIKARRGFRLNPLDIALTAYIGATLLWAYFGYPEWLARLTLMSMAPANRALLGLGVASILLSLSVFCGDVKKKDADANKSNPISLLLQMTAIGLVAYLTLFEIGKAYPDFVTLKILIVMTVMLSLWGVAFINRAKATLCILTLLFVVNGLQVNPLVHGVTALKSAQLASVLHEDRLSGNTLWIVSPEIVHAQYLKANGANVWSGTRFMSDPVQMRLLDPTEKYRHIWYRYAHFSIEPLPAGSATFFELPHGSDTIVLNIDFCSESLAVLGINRFAFTSQQDLKQLKCLEPLRTNTVEGLWLYKMRSNIEK